MYLQCLPGRRVLAVFTWSSCACCVYLVVVCLLCLPGRRVLAVFTWSSCACCVYLVVVCLLREDAEQALFDGQSSPRRLATGARAAQQRPQTLTHRLDARHDVERHRKRRARLDVVHVEFGARKLPLDVLVNLTITCMWSSRMLSVSQ